MALLKPLLFLLGIYLSSYGIKLKLYFFNFLIDLICDSFLDLLGALINDTFKFAVDVEFFQLAFKYFVKYRLEGQVFRLIVVILETQDTCPV